MCLIKGAFVGMKKEIWYFNLFILTNILLVKLPEHNTGRNYVLLKVQKASKCVFVPQVMHRLARPKGVANKASVRFRHAEFIVWVETLNMVDSETYGE